MIQDQATIIARQNDIFRRSMFSLSFVIPGRVMVTRGVSHLTQGQRLQIFDRVIAFSDFNEGNDPYGEHDFGEITLAGVGSLFWKIDYFDIDYEYGSENPADIGQTRRVLTIMLASEY